METQAIREILLEMDELRKDFDARWSGLERKLKIAIGDVRERPKVVEFTSPFGSFSVGKNGKKGEK